MTPMLERLARVWGRRIKRGKEEPSEALLKVCRADVRALLQELREPDEAIMDAMAAESVQIPGKTEFARDEAERLIRAYVDAALGEQR